MTALTTLIAELQAGTGASGDLSLEAASLVRALELAAIVTSTTAARPSAVLIGAGGQYYDTTLSKPGFSDGAVWRDAAGTAI